MSLTRILEIPLVYRAWQGPFARKKMAPILRNNDLRNAGKVLDIGCGPGTNAAFFEGANYLGVDLNPKYVSNAQARYPKMRFVAADATVYDPKQRFDFVLLNSVLHHLDDDQVNSVLATARKNLLPQGSVHIIELLTSSKRIPGMLARNDRGGFPRPLERWRELLLPHFSESMNETFAVTGCAISLWELVYFKCTPK